MQRKDSLDPRRFAPLSTYAPDAQRVRNRPVETMVWLLTGVMVSFVLLSTFHPAVQQHMRDNPSTFTAGLVVTYLMFLVFSRRIFRRQRVANVRLVTTRRTFTHHDGSGEKTHGWRDVKRAELRVEVDAAGQAYVRRYTLTLPKSTVQLDNDPLLPLGNAEGLTAEIRQRVSDVRWTFHWLHPICPLCAGALDVPKRTCEACAASIAYVSKLRRPWELVSEETLYVALLLLVLAPSWPILYLVALSFLAAIPVRALLRARSRRFCVLRAAGETVAESGNGSAAADVTSPPVRRVGVGVGILLVGMLAAPVAAEPSAPSTAPSTSSFWGLVKPPPTPAPRPTDASYVPLAVGNTWEYRSSFDRVVMRVTRQEVVNGTLCHVVESFVGDAPDCVQREYYAVGSTGLEVCKRVHGGSEFFLDPPEPMLRFPAREGLRWTWQAPAVQGAVALTFEIKGERRTNVLGRDEITLLVTIHGRSTDGSEIQTKRWYARGIGMVREQTVLKKAGKTTSMESTLQNYSLRVGPPSSE